MDSKNRAAIHHNGPSSTIGLRGLTPEGEAAGSLVAGNSRPWCRGICEETDCQKEVQCDTLLEVKGRKDEERTPENTYQIKPCDRWSRKRK